MRLRVEFGGRPWCDTTRFRILGDWILVRRRSVRVLRKRLPTVLVVQSRPALQELLEQALRDAAAIVLVTGDRNEALEVARRVEIDFLVIDSDDDGLLRELCALQAGLEVLLLGSGRVSLSEVRQAVKARRSPRRRRSDVQEADDA